MIMPKITVTCHLGHKARTKYALAISWLQYMIHMHPRLATKIHSIIGSIYKAQLKIGENLLKNWGPVLANFACIYEKSQ